MIVDQRNHPFAPGLPPGRDSDAVPAAENEVGEEGIDQELVLRQAGKEEIVLLSNGASSRLLLYSRYRS